ncbi:hypothetical protein CFP56_042598 [Quercus suber]|uniref:Uncharacterized protein n=1 Tax=Quercus suber TaxID=58331 RepID=A0AAW0ITZ0_QUESU
MGCVHWNWNSILANRLYCQVDTCSTHTIAQLPKDEIELRTGECNPSNKQQAWNETCAKSSSTAVPPRAFLQYSFTL